MIKYSLAIFFASTGVTFAVIGMMKIHMWFIVAGSSVAIVALLFLVKLLMMDESEEELE